MRTFLSILFAFSLIITSCSPETNVLKSTLEFETLELRTAQCGFLENPSENVPSTLETELITVRGFSEAAISQALESISATKRAIFFPRGVYNIPLYTQPDGRLTSRTVLNFNETSDIEIYGEQGTIIRMVYGGDFPPLLPNLNARLITVSNSSNIYIHDLDLRSVFNFAQSEGVAGVSNDDSAIFIRNSNNIHLNDISTTRIAGDCINIGAMRNQTTSNIYISNVDMDNVNRNGITIGGRGEINSVFISDCDFGRKIRVQQIDFEPLKFASVQHVQIENNRFDKLIPSSRADRQGAISALSRIGDGISCVLIKNNQIRNDVVIARSCSDFLIEDNSQIPSMIVRNNSNNITVSRNEFNIEVAAGLDRDRNTAGIIIAANPLSPDEATQDVAYAEPSEIYFNNNTVSLRATKTAITTAVVVKNADAVRAEANTIQFSRAAEDNLGFYAKFNKTDLPQPTLDKMRLGHCDNSFIGIPLQENTIALDINSDDNTILVSNCN